MSCLEINRLDARSDRKPLVIGDGLEESKGRVHVLLGVERCLRGFARPLEVPIPPLRILGLDFAAS